MAIVCKNLVFAMAAIENGFGINHNFLKKLLQLQLFGGPKFER